MNFSEWLVIISFIVILLGLIGIGWWIKNKIPNPSPPNEFTNPLVWSQPTPGPDPKKNTCQLYQFPSINLNGTIIPGTPTFDSNILNKLTGQLKYPMCLDTDQIIAQQLQHTCIAPRGVVDGSITRCFLMDGSIGKLGDKEIYYSNSQCFNVPPCPGRLSVVSLNFQAPGFSNIYCLQKNGLNANITMAPCDPSNENQIFRVTRIDPGQNPNSLKQGEGQNGLFAQIFDRDTGLCVVPGNSTTTTIYDPSYIHHVMSDCGGNPEVIQGTNLVLGPCKGGIYPGYVWALIPSVFYCGEPQGCKGCTGTCTVKCQRRLGSNSCYPCPYTGTCEGSEALPTSQQIVYIGNLNLNNIPLGDKEYQGLKGSSALIKWLLDNNAQSMFFGGGGNGVILRSIEIDYESCKGRSYNSQYLDIVTYNTLKNLEICIANNDLKQCRF